MFKSVVRGTLKYDPQFKIIKGRQCCNFTILTFDKNKSLVRCSCWDEKALMMKESNVKKGTCILGMGNSSNVSYGLYENYVFNLELDYVEILS